MTNKLIYQTLVLILLGTVLIVWFGCGSSDDSSSDNPTVAENASSDDSIAEVATGNLKGRVVRIEGVQIDVQVLQDGTVIASTEAKPDGSYQIDNIKSGTYTVQITAKGYKVVEQTVQVRAGEVPVLDNVALEALEAPVTHIRGLVLDQETKTLLNGARVQLINEARVVREVLTKQTGVFEFENVPADQQFTLIIDGEKYEKQEITINPIPAGETEKVEVELVPLPRVRGLLLDQITKDGIQSAHVQLIEMKGMMNWGDVREAETNALGVFEFENVPTDQQFALIIDIDGYQKQEITINPISGGEIAKVEVELVPINPDQLPIGDGLRVGVEAPAFSLPDQDGKIRTLADYAGQKVVLAFDRGRW
jgi:hypothetical protein